MAAVVEFVLANFMLNFLVLGALMAVVSLALRRAWVADEVVEAVFRWFLFFSIGVSFLYNFVVHVFFGEMAARYIGWEQSPFQAEVGLASLGYSAVGFLAFRGGWELRLAAVVGPACFLLGAAAGHAYQMVVAHNFQPGNAGVIFYADIGIPILGFVLLALQHRFGRPGDSATDSHRSTQI